MEAPELIPPEPSYKGRGEDPPLPEPPRSPPTRGYSTAVKGKPHYSVSRGGGLPHFLLHHQYIGSDFPNAPKVGRAPFPEWSTSKFEDYGRGELIYSPYHVSGDPIHFIDLRYYVNLPAAFALLEQEHIAIEEVSMTGHPEVDDRTLESLSQSPLFSRSIHAVDVSRCQYLSLAADSRALPSLLKIERLNALSIADLAGVDDKTIALLCSTLGSLTALDVSGCTALTNEALKAVATGLRPTLRSLAAGRNGNFTYHGANEVLYLCEGVQHMNFAACPKLDFMGVVVRANDGSLQHVSRCLTEACLDGCQGMDEVALEWLCTANSDLRVVSLAGLRALRDSMVAALATACPDLRYLSVPGCARVTGASVSLIGSGRVSSQLLELNISNIGELSSHHVTLLLCRCKSLKTLNLSGNKRLGDSMFADILIDESSAPIAGQPPRSTRDASTGATLYYTSQITLEKLFLAGTALTSFGVACMAERCTELRVLDLSDLPHVTDSAASVIAGCCKRLRELRANNCYGLTDRAVIELCYACPKLEVLQLSSRQRFIDAWGTRYTQYTDDALVAALDGPKLLRELTFQNQFGISCSSRWLREGFKGHYRLRHLNLAGADRVGPDSLVRLCRACFDLNHAVLSGEDVWPGIDSDEFRAAAFRDAPYARLDFVAAPSRPGTATSGVEGLSEQLADAYAASGRTATAPAGTIGANGIVQDAPAEVFEALRPHPLAEIWRFRDQYVRRRLTEFRAANIISFKFKLYRMWKRIRRRISCRKIEGWYMRRMEQYLHKERVREFTERRSARLIQRSFREVMKPRFLASMKIQAMFRRFALARRVRLRKSLVKAATDIQRVFRGLLVRLSDRFILSQLYLKLPPFWREIMKSAPPAETKQQRKRLFPYEIEEKREEARVMTEHILSDVARGGVLQPKLPFVVPQPFDKSPYVSLSDGHKLTFYSHTNGLLHSDVKRSSLKGKLERAHDAVYRKKDLAAAALNPKKAGGGGEVPEAPHRSVHVFNITFWPLTEPSYDEDPSTLHYDPMVNNFEVAQNYRVALHCEVCKARLRIIHCKTCQKGYCFFCAFKSHTEMKRRNHSMQIMEPRIVKIKEVSKSLNYNLDMAKRASYDLGYLVKYMRNASEVKRMQREKELAKQFELAEEQRRKTFLVAQREGVARHDAAIEISLLYRVFKAKRVVAQKRSQLALESINRRMMGGSERWVPVQSMWRMHATRKYFERLGVSFKKKRKKRGQKEELKAPLEFALVQSRIDFELRNRAYNKRAAIIYQLVDTYAQARQLLDANLAYWLDVLARVPPQVERLDVARQAFLREHEEQSQITAAKKAELPEWEYEILEKELHRLYVRVEGTNTRVMNLRNLCWWVAQHVRGLLRRKAVFEVRLKDTYARLAWTAAESARLNRIIFQMDFRLQKFREDPSMKIPVDWLSKYVQYAEVHDAALDAQQESILLEECSRVDRDHHTTVEFDSLLLELYNGVVADSQYVAEKVHLEKEALRVKPATEEALLNSEQLLALKRKQTQLTENVIDTLKGGLQTKLNDEDEYCKQLYGFPGDEPDLKVEEMSEKISATLLETFRGGHHCKVTDFLQVYYAQPWINEMAVSDVRYEELIRKKIMDLDKANVSLRIVEAKVRDLESTILDTEKKIEGLEAEMARRELTPEDEPPELKEERLVLLATFTGEKFKKESENIANDAMLKKNKELMPGIQTEIESMVKELQTMEDRLEKRQAERARLVESFFDKEERATEDMFAAVAEAISRAEKRASALAVVSKVREVAVSSVFIVDRIVGEKLTPDERNALQIPVGTARYHYQDALSKVFGRTEAPALSVLSHAMGALRNAGVLDQEVMAGYIEALHFEEHEMEQFTKKRKMYTQITSLLVDSLLYQRRQRTTQKELEERKVRLEEFREHVMRALSEAEDKRRAEEAAMQAEQKRQMDEIIANRQPVVKQLAQATKRAVRGVKDAIKAIKNSAEIAMDKEEQRMAATIRARNHNAGAAAKPEAIRRMYMTQGDEDSESFGKQQTMLAEKGLPFYVKMDKSIGNQVFIWTEATMDPSKFVTNIQFGHKHRGHPQFKQELEDDETYDRVTHDKIHLIIYFKRELNKIRAYQSLQVSMSEVEENRNLVDGYSKFEQTLEEFDLPDIYLWHKQVLKLSHEESVDARKLLKEVVKSRELLAQKPGDKNLADLVKRQNDQLAKAYDRYKNFEVDNPLRRAIEFLALSPKELDMWMGVFKKVDSRKEGLLSSDDMFSFFEETPTVFTKYIFSHVDAFNRQEQIEFGDFMRAVGTYCMFEKQEMCQFLYAFADRDKGNGTITHDQFVSLLNTLYPYDKKRAKRGLKELNMIPGKEMKFDEFRRYCDEFPAFFFPAFRLQNSMRSKIMGTDWWFDKLKKYKQVRRKLVSTGKQIDDMAELEMTRFVQDERRAKRSVELEEEIKKEPSTLRKALLTAKLFVNETS